LSYVGTMALCKLYTKSVDIARELKGTAGELAPLEITINHVGFTASVNYDSVKVIFLRKESLGLTGSKLLIELNHIFSHLNDSCAKGFRCEHLYLVTIAKYPPAYFTQTVNAKLHRG